MEAEARYTLVGAALVLLVAALAAALLWLQDAGGRRDFAYYLIFFEHQALDGLQVGGDVNVRGIKVGRVEDFSLTDTINRVRVTVRIDRRVPVAENTVAIVTRNLVTGIASINLITPADAGPPLVKVPDGLPYPVIAEGESDLDALTGRFGQIGDLAAEAIGNFNRAFRAENREALSAAIRNLRDLTEGLNARLASLDRSLAAFDAAAKSLGRAGDRIAVVAENAGGRLEPALAQADKTLLAVADAAHALQAEAKRLGAQLERAAGATDDQIALLSLELRASMESFNRALDRFRDPAAAVLGPAPAQLGPGEGAR
ncbi:MAG TPA: MlaD family protein [Burkholderiaceae bacterium]|jgi:phospholipid/cholesterol/gamma-HCH transport system substrate-binding protein|nr:MlaD family protein [Burkholderiaceae bacterium]